MHDAYAADVQLPALDSLRERLAGRRFVLAWWAASRAVVFAVALGLHLVGGAIGYFGHAQLRAPFGALVAWDGKWYRMVAEHGYLLVSGRQSDPAFFPAFPLVLAGAHALELPTDVAAVVVANVAFLVGLLAFHELSRTVIGDAAARRAVILVCVFPLSFVFSMAYPQSLVFAAVSVAALLALRDRWLAAAAVGAAAALARPEALFVAVPLAAIAWSHRHGLSPRRRGAALAAIASPAAAFAAFPLYLDWLLHDPFAWSRAQRAWGRSFSATGPVRALEQLPAAIGQNPGLIRDVVFFVLYAALLAYGAHRRLPRAWLAAGACVVVLPLFSESFESEARFGLLALPVFWSLALAVRRTGLRPVVAGSLVLLAVCTASLPYTFP